MADCGATGSTIDRAARALFGSNDAKAAASLMGHAFAAVGPSQQQQLSRPMSAPDTILLPQFQSMRQETVAVQPAAAQLQQSAETMHQVDHSMCMPQKQQHHMYHQFHHQQQQIPHFIQQQQHQQMQHQHMHQQQHQFMMMQQQQHQLQLMAHQQQQQQQQQLHAHQQIQQPEYRNETTSDQEQDHEQEYPDGMVQGATIQELAAAWAEAEADYEELESAVNLASAVDLDETAQAVPDYEFIHAMDHGSETEQRLAPDGATTSNDPSAAPVTDWMEQGMRHFANGELQEAIRDFEMELQHNNTDNATAWRMLGRCHAENDQDRLAIICLEQAVDRDPYNQEARLALGVSYVNELNHAKALEHLKAWITHNPKYAQLDIGEDLYGAGSADNVYSEPGFDEVQRLLLTALEFDPSDAVDVLGALGVVYNVSRDYDAAIDAFQKALVIQSEDYQLHNRLGATLANCNKSEQALPAYKRAIELKPKFTRAWLNMAISHANLHNYDEAARCYLQTLSLNPAATHCWSYLRVALSSGHHWELLPCAASMDLDAFREHFDFI